MLKDSEMPKEIRPIDVLCDSLPLSEASNCGVIDEILLFDPVSGSTSSIANDGRITLGSVLFVRGWALDVLAASLATGIIIQLGAERAEAAYGALRDDIAAHFGNSAFKKCGFSGFVPTNSAGNMQLQVFAVDAAIRTLLPIATGSRAFEVINGTMPWLPSLPRRNGSAQIVLDGIIHSSVFKPIRDMRCELQVGTAFSLVGWAIDLPSGAVPRSIYALIDHDQIVRGRIGNARPDVASHFGNDDLLNCGFEIKLDGISLAPGTHAIEIAIVTADGVAHDLSGFHLNIISTM
jgi:hypothetical protein